jgi:hypothetical protein
MWYKILAGVAGVLFLIGLIVGLYFLTKGKEKPPNPLKVAIFSDLHLLPDYN